MNSRRVSERAGRARVAGGTAAAVALLLVCSWRAPAVAQQGKSVWDGVYSDVQAKRGGDAYQRECAYCHQPDLTGGFFDNGTGRAPALAGPKAFDSSFVDRWSDSTVGEFVATIAATMPQNRPASLSVETYVDIAAFVMSKNGIPAGATDLPASVEIMQGIAIGRK